MELPVAQKYRGLTTLEAVTAKTRELLPKASPSEVVAISKAVLARKGNGKPVGMAKKVKTVAVKPVKAVKLGKTVQAQGKSTDKALPDFGSYDLATMMKIQAAVEQRITNLTGEIAAAKTALEKLTGGQVSV